MNIKITNTFLGLIVFGLMIAVFSAIFSPSSVSADAVGDKATQYCTAQYPENNSSGIRNRAACVFGYKRGYSQSTGNDCGRYASTHRGTYSACKKGKVQGLSDGAPSPTNPTTPTGKNDCAGVQTFFKFDCSGKNKDQGGDANPIIALLLTGLSWLTGLVALATVGGIVYGGILYTSAQDNASQTQKGITFIVNSVLGLVLWIAAYALINFIVPGGLF